MCIDVLCACMCICERERERDLRRVGCEMESGDRGQDVRWRISVCKVLNIFIVL